MTWPNCTEVTEFLFSGFTDRPEFQITLFAVFLVVYAVTLMGNLGLIVLIRLDSQLHIPMYFFLSNLAFVDFWYSTFITPKFLADLLAERKVISYSGCVSQYCFVSFLGITECFLLAAMAYDRYVAICNPLLYTAVMSPRRCVQLVAGSFLAGFVNGMIQTIITLKLSFCGPSIIDFFFCDISPLLSLSCSDTSSYSVILLAEAYLFGVFCGVMILISYFFIFSTILKFRSWEAKSKGFSTCTSHLTVIILYYGTALFIYMQPNTKHSRDNDKVISLFYTVVTPMLNPLVYSLRNKEVKNAFKRVIERAYRAVNL